MSMVYGNKTVYGQKIGVLMLNTHFPRIPGDIGNALTFPFPVVFRIVNEATADSVVLKQDPALIEPFIKAARELEEDGCKCVITSCGFMAIFHREIASAVNIPVISSSLLQVRLVASMLAPGKKVGILTAKASSLGEKHFSGVGIEDVDMVVYGIENTEFSKTFFEDRNYIDIDLAKKEMTETAVKMIAEHPDVGAIVLECTNMPPFTRIIQRTTGLPVFDIINLIRYVHDAIVSPGYNGNHRFFPGEEI